MYEYGSDPENDMWMDYDYHMNTGELEEYFPEETSDEESVEENEEFVEENLSLDEVIKLLEQDIREKEKLLKKQQKK